MGPRILKSLPSLVLVLMLVLVAQAQTPHPIQWPFPSGARASVDRGAGSDATTRTRAANAAAAAARGELSALECDPILILTSTAQFEQPLDSPTMMVRQVVTGTAVISYALRDVSADLVALSPVGVVTYTILAVDAESGEPTFETVALHRRRAPAAEPRAAGLVRPLVMKTHPGVAQDFAVTYTVALQADIDDPGFGAVVGYAMDGPPGTITLTAELSNGLPPPLLGSRPVLGIEVCTRTNVPDDMDDLQVVQQIMRVTGPLPFGGVSRVLQEFTVPVTTTVIWAEAPMQWLPTPDAVTPSPVVVSLRTGGEPVPPSVLVPTATADRIFDDLSITGASGPQWMSSGRFPLPAVLYPGNTYTLELEMTGRDYMVGADQSSGGATLPGRLFYRSSDLDDWIEFPFADLAFRLIGVEGVAGPPDPLACDVNPILTVVAVPASPTAALRVEHGAAAIQMVPGSNPRPIGSASFRAAGHLVATLTAEILAVENGVPLIDETYPLRVVTITPNRDPDSDDDGYARMTLATPLVTRSVTSTPAFMWRDDGDVGFLFERPSGDPMHLVYGSSVATATPYPLLREGPGGWLPVESVTVTALGSICGMTDTDGDDGSDLAVVAQLLRVTDPAPGAVDPVSPTAETGYVLRFVPAVTATAEWLEFAVARTFATGTCEVSLYDAAGMTSPPNPLEGPLGTCAIAPVPGTLTAQTWMATDRMSSPPLLEAGHPYFLQVRTGHEWLLGTAAVTATSCNNCQFFTQAEEGTPWVEDPTRNLSFRLIGRPVVPSTDVPGGPPVATGFAMALGPNPSRGAVAMSWSGGGGRVRIEVTDVAGRVIRRVRDAGPAAGGRWVWDGRDDRGREAAAGVYFARVSGERGVLAARRVVRVR